MISYLFHGLGFDVGEFDTSEFAIQLAKIVSEKAINDGMGANVVAVQGTAYTFGHRANFSAETRATCTAIPAAINL